MVRVADKLRRTFAPNGCRSLSHDGSLSLQQARHALELKHQAQRYHDVINVAAAGCLGKLFRDVLPRIALSTLGRQMTFDQLAHVGKRF